METVIVVLIMILLALIVSAFVIGVVLFEIRDRLDDIKYAVDRGPSLPGFSVNP